MQISNEPEVIADGAEEDRASEIDVEKRELPITKTLGVLSKLLIQKAWLEARDWDELLPTPHQREWTRWFRELEDFELVKITRCLKNPSPEVEELSIHTLSDASENAYTAVVYARHVYEDGNITTRLIMSKSRLVPLKAVSIPRLEVLGALIGLRLTRQVCSALKIPTNGVTYWVDSMNVGYSIQGQSGEYKPFIAHRVAEIHEFSAPNQWRYVPTDVNPADLGTRGVTVEDLAQACLWWNGPEFLKKSKQDWPECKYDKPTSTENLELKGTKETGTKDAISYQIIEEGAARGVAIGPLKILEMVSSQNKRRTGNWVVFSSCDSVGALQTIVENQLNKERGVN
ncbi:uncharacterized protein [Montipora capricornis]|uniref:uncharacterized protein n=1 Tax=Montipora capricornis TaxID=246305 RepID=UPI0035F16C22